jgi:hypothetical protein
MLLYCSEKEATFVEEKTSIYRDITKRLKEKNKN